MHIDADIIAEPEMADCQMSWKPADKMLLGVKNYYALIKNKLIKQTQFKTVWIKQGLSSKAKRQKLCKER